jgi:Protein of unknown function (DUF3106)
MQSFAKFRFLLQPALAALVLLSAASGRAAQFGGHRGGGIGGHPAVTAARPGGQKQNSNQDHLKQWMNRHNSPEEQQRALENEPGFHDLPQQTQQRFRDKLNQLNNMPPEQRRRTLERTEMMERLTPDQRQQLRGSVQQLGRLPDDRRRLVARAFRDLREMPVPQRQAILNSDRFHSQFSDQERGTLSGLLAVEPYIPVEHPNTAPAPAVGK